MGKHATDIESERMLVKRIREGDLEAFKDMYELNYHAAYTVCIKILKNSSLAEDICQEVFIQVWKKIDKFKGEAKLSTWIHRIAVNQCLMYFRKSHVKKENRYLSDDSIEMTLQLSEKVALPQFDLNIELADAIAQLPDGYKNVFHLKEVEGFEHEEVARILGCSVGTSKSQHHKARIKLGKLLTKKFNPKVSLTFSESLG